MQLTTQDIENIAKLARLNLTDEEKKRYSKQITTVLDYVEMLNEVDTENAPETSQVTKLENIVRNDEVVECDIETRKKLLSQFPDNKDNLLKVKAVFN